MTNTVMFVLQAITAHIAQMQMVTPISLKNCHATKAIIALIGAQEHEQISVTLDITAQTQALQIQSSKFVEQELIVHQVPLKSSHALLELIHSVKRLNLNQIAILVRQALHAQLLLLIHSSPSSLVKQAITVFRDQMKQMNKNALQVICVLKVSALPFCVRLAHINQIQVSLIAKHVQKATTATEHQLPRTSLAQEAATA